MSGPRGTPADRELRGGQGLADIVRDNRDAVLDAYLHRLTQINILRDETSRSQCVEHAAEILADLEESLRAGHPQAFASDPSKLARKIAANRATEGIPPSESLRAAAELFDVSITTLCGSAAGVSPEATVAMPIALNTLIGMRLQEAASAYGQFMLERICEAYAEERRRIARDLHDRVAQNVVAAERNLEFYLLSDVPRDDQRIVKARAALSQTVTSIRQVTADLRFVRPVDSLGSAARSYLDTLDPEGVNWHVRVNGDDGSLPLGVRDQMYLVLCEAIRNAVVHAQPTRLDVIIDINPYDLWVTVADDGLGIDPSRAVTRTGSGLVSMRERTELLGGTLSMSSTPGCGTHVEIFVPLEPKPYGESDGNHEHHHS
jgi:signal transduction histidine kinase